MCVEFGTASEFKASGIVLGDHSAHTSSSIHLTHTHTLSLSLSLSVSCVYRCHTVEEFNRGIYDYVIATDEFGSTNSTVATSSSAVGEGGGGGGGGGGEGGGGGGGRKRVKRKKDKEYGVCRGIDFQGVENVVNFDFPPTPEAYVHRVGR